MGACARFRYARLVFTAGSAPHQRGPTFMPEPAPGRSPTHQKHKSLLERLTAFIFREPENREELLEALHDAHERDLLDADALSMIEGVLQVS
jgi:magnesium and cobalt transporter